MMSDANSPRIQPEVALAVVTMVRIGVGNSPTIPKIEPQAFARGFFVFGKSSSGDSLSSYETKSLVLFQSSKGAPATGNRK